MPSVVIVTDQCYLLAEAVNYIVINEDNENDDRNYMLDPPRKRGSSKKKKTFAQKNKDIREYIQERKPFLIIINFVAKNSPPNNHGQNPTRHGNNDDNPIVNVRVMGLRRTIKVFRDIVKQMREQIPDEKFLDTLVESFLTETEDQEEMIDKMELR
jgi:hypothetical protein